MQLFYNEHHKQPKHILGIPADKMSQNPLDIVFGFSGGKKPKRT
jgi:hypothetical protein